MLLHYFLKAVQPSVTISLLSALWSLEIRRLTSHCGFLRAPGISVEGGFCFFAVCCNLTMLLLCYVGLFLFVKIYRTLCSQNSDAS